VIPEPAQWVLNVGYIVGVAVAAFFSRRAANNSQRGRASAENTESVIVGMQTEPDIRELIRELKRGTAQQLAAAEENLKAHRDEVLILFRGLHGDIAGLGDRIDGLTGRVGKLEGVVFEAMEKRLVSVEQAAKESGTLGSALSSVNKLVITIVDRIDRAQANIHKLAQAAGIKLLTPEEVEDQIRQLRPEKDKP
jgi:ABC-type transporter Mla subunit MlaD